MAQDHERDRGGYTGIDMPLLNTNSFHADLTGVFIADLALQILAWIKGY